MNISQAVVAYVHSIADQFPGLQTDPVNPGYRDERDAFRHAYMSAFIADNFTSELARLAMSKYEKQSPNTDPKSQEIAGSSLDIVHYQTFWNTLALPLESQESQ